MPTAAMTSRGHVLEAAEELPCGLAALVLAVIPVVVYGLSDAGKSTRKDEEAREEEPDEEGG